VVAVVLVIDVVEPVVAEQVTAENRLVEGGDPQIGVRGADPGIPAPDRDAVDQLKRRLAIAPGDVACLVRVGAVCSAGDADLGPGDRTGQGILEKRERRAPSEPVPAGRGVIVDVENATGAGGRGERGCHSRDDQPCEAMAEQHRRSPRSPSV
jgi:hypothetical protein